MASTKDAQAKYPLPSSFPRSLAVAVLILLIVLLNPWYTLVSSIFSIAWWAPKMADCHQVLDALQFWMAMSSTGSTVAGPVLVTYLQH